MSMEEAAAEIVSPVVAEGPYRVMREAVIPHRPVVVDRNGTRVATVDFPHSEAQADLLASSWDLLAACEAASGLLTRSGGTLDLEEAFTVRNRLYTAIARARGLRPCDDPVLVPEVMKAQPQCVHGEKTKEGGFSNYRCAAHPLANVDTLRHEHPNGGVWYSYVCDGYLEEQKGSGG